MNFLAHTYLSGNNEKVIIGNFIGDHVKRNNYKNYHKDIAQGILLHRFIDSYTDKHALIKEMKQYFSPKYRLYSGVIIDVLMDHFLAINWSDYHHKSLKKYVNNIYRILASNFFSLPIRVQGFLPFLIKNNRLYNYSKIEGVESSLNAMTRYTSLPKETEFAIETLNKNYHALNDLFKRFMEDVILAVKDK